MHPVYLHQYYQTYRKHAAAAGTRAPHEGLLRTWLRARVKEWRKRLMVLALSSMDDWLLRDIGIDRGQIREIVDGLEDHELRMRPVDRRAASAFDGIQGLAMPGIRAT